MQPTYVFADAEDAAAPGLQGAAYADLFIGPEDTAQSLREEFYALMCSLVTIWCGFVVIAGCGYVLSAWLAWTGQEFDLSKPLLLWLPIALIAATGPVWLPVTVWIELRDLRIRLALVARRDRLRG